MNPTLDYFSLSCLIIENKRKSLTDRKVSLLCNKDAKYCAKNNPECGKQSRGTNYLHDKCVFTRIWHGWTVDHSSVMQTPGSNGLSLTVTGSDTNTMVSRLHCDKCLFGETQAVAHT